MSYPMVSIIILNYNGRRHLGKVFPDCIRSALKTEYRNFEVILVDNASADDSVRFAKEEFGKDPMFRIIENDRNLGFAEGNNSGIRQARGELVVLLNSDTRVEPNWLENLVRAAQPMEIGAVQSKLLNMDNPLLLDSAGGFVDAYGYHWERGRGEVASRYGKVDEIFYAKGASVLLKKSALRRSGLFDSDIFMYFDETDLCWRLKLAGFKVLFAPDSVVYHAAGKTASAVGLRNRLYLHTRNHILVLTKNYSLLNLAKAIIVSILFETRNFFVFLARGNPLVSLSIVEALWWNLRHLAATWKKRTKVQSFVRKVEDKEIQKIMLSPMPPFPLYLVFSRGRYLRKRANVNSVYGEK